MSTPELPPYLAAKQRVRAGGDPHAEAEQLVEQMTIDEKLACLDGDTEFWDGLVDMIRGGYYRHPYPAARVERLGFPGLSFSDGPRGIVVGHATCFPVTMARGASFDVELEERIGDAIGKEARIQGADFYGGVCVNLLRHPAWGRAQETYGEDPVHLGEMGAALVRGVQRHAMACVKHFACNSIENARFQVDVRASEEVLDRVYLAHFRRIVEEGVASVMTSYNSLNGEWCGQSFALIARTLRERWGFDGIVVSDFINGLRDPVKSVQAGLDIEMPFRQQRAQALGRALDEGELALAEVEAAARRVVATILRFDAATPDEAPDAALLAGPEHRALAREAAAASAVLLRNEVAPGDAASLLPLDAAHPQRIAVLGHLAEVANLGDGGSSNVHPPSVVTPMAGLREALPEATFVDDAKDSDLAIVVVGYTFEDEGEFTGGGDSPELLALMPPVPDEAVWGRIAEAASERKGMALGGDRRSLRLRDEDEALIAATVALQPRCIVVLLGCSAILVEGWFERVPAILQLWYPGMEGGRALADVLTGRSDPGGRLPFAVPRDEAHLPFFDRDAKSIVYDEWHGQWLLDRDGHEARFAYGFGLSYTRFALSRARREGDTVRVDVANEGARAGSVVVFFFRPEGATKKLVGFRKLRLEAGASSTASLLVKDGSAVVVALHAGDPGALRVPPAGRA